MLCDNCSKREASVRYEESINGKKKIVNLCEECSKKIGIFNMNFMDNMFMSFFDESMPIGITKSNEIKCNKCGYVFSDYAKSGLLGCSECYTTFKDKLEPLLKKLHGKTYHVDVNGVNKKDEKSASTNKNNEVEILKKKLNECIEKEEYEKAAVIRDEIKKLSQRSDK